MQTKLEHHCVCEKFHITVAMLTTSIDTIPPKLLVESYRSGTKVLNIHVSVTKNLLTVQAEEDKIINYLLFNVEK